MRRSALIVLAALTALPAVPLVASSNSAEAQTRRSRSVVVITPRYLTAGTQVGPGEFRAAVPYADARFRSGANDLPGQSLGPYFVDPFYLRHPHTTIAIDSPLGRKLPGER
jgi:hypothetical protein